jgi:ADP-ribose pyrophosphatase YjhB (NUDIX family)
MKRSTEPFKGNWTIPGGFMEEAEQPEAAAARELFEETQARIDKSSLELFAVGSLPMMNQVYLVYRGVLLDEQLGTSMEAEEVGLFGEDEAPWDAYAFPALEDVVRQFYADLKRNQYGVYCCVFEDGKHRYRDTTKANRSAISDSPLCSSTLEHQLEQLKK